LGASRSFAKRFFTMGDGVAELDAKAWYVMDATADDWESIEQIRPHIHECFRPISDEQILELLRELHSAGLVEMMDDEGYATHTFAPTNWFRMTKVGRSIWDKEGAKCRGS
jgi:hypothetical protein